MTNTIRKKYLAVILTLAMMISLLPAMTLFASAAATSLINIRANYNTGYEEGCLIGPDAGTTDSAGNTYAIGSLLNYQTTSAAMASPLAAADFGGTVLTQSNNSTGTVFICKYDTYGALVWAKAIGSEKSNFTYGDCGKDIKVDSSGNVYIVGSFMGKFDYGQDGSNEATGLTGNGNGFVAKLNSSGNLQWVIPIVASSGGSSADALALDSSGNVYITGSYNESATATNANSTTVTLATGINKNIFVMELSSAGIIQWAQTAQSGDDAPEAYDISVSSDGSAVYAVGTANGLTISGTPTSSGNTDGYVMKFNGSGTLQWFGRTTGSDNDRVYAVRVDASGNPVIMGWWGNIQTTLDIDPSAATKTPDSSLGALGNFVAALSPTDGAISWYAGTDSNSYLDSLYIDSSAVYIGGYCSNSTAYYTSAGSATGSIETSASHLLIKFTTTGAFSLAKTLGNEYPSNEHDKLTDISAADGGGLRIIASVAAAFDIDPGAGITNAHGTSDDNRTNAMAIFTVTADCAPSAFEEDTTAPTISSASRTDNTHITVTLSEACQNLSKANDGGFTVTKTGTANTYAVSATSAGAGNTVVLTVADMSSAGSAGVKVTYATGGNGTIADTAGNAMAADATGKTVAAWDTASPSVSSINRNSPVSETTNSTGVTFRVTFSESVTGVDISDFSLTTTETATGTVSAVSSVSGSVYDVTVNTISGAGTLRLDLKSSGTGIA
ncbi:MAG: hypothetical protein EOM14_10335, partial [Clostridia bacterium]|nr:hypothetical protein [Clostridia bacterium]